MGKMMRALGLMSGTSMDAIDIALIDTDGRLNVQAGLFASYPYSPQFQSQLRKGLDDAKAISHRDERPGRLAMLEQYITDLHAEAVSQFLEDFDIPPSDIDLVGFHGHTVIHRPEAGLTVQIGDGPRLAELCGIDVVYDMRAADCAAGGVGAPLAPIYHRTIASRQSRRVAILNVGGVANVTVIDGPDAPEDSLIAFDTGPGNALIDDWVLRHTGRSFDEGGALCAAGKVDEERLAALLAHDYFSQSPPKALDRSSFDLAPIEGLTIEDGAATLCEFTAQAVARALPFMAAKPEFWPEFWIVTGGGRKNGALMQRIAAAVGAPVVAAEAAELEGDAIEAQAWAYLAVRSKLGLPITFPGTTGTPKPLTGGTLAKSKST